MKKRDAKGQLRDYKKEAAQHRQPLQRERHAARLRARRKMEKEGKVHPHDGKEVDHKNQNPGGNLSNRQGNLRVLTRTQNRKRQPKHK